MTIRFTGKEYIIMSKVDEVVQNLNTLIQKKKINKTDRVCVFGYNNLTMEVIEILKKNNFTDIVVVDNSKTGKAIYSLDIYKPDDVLKVFDANIRILIASSYYKEMSRQIVGFSRKYKNNIYRLSNIKTHLRLKKDIIYHFPNLYNNFLYSTGYFLDGMFNKQAHELISSNTKFKGIHDSKRCFILGNGPSLDRVNTELLKDEIIFGVNQIMDTQLFDKIDMTYWVCIERAFFGMTVDGTKDYYKKIEKLQGKVKLCFVPIEGQEYINNYGLEQKLPIAYMAAQLKYENLEKNLPISREIDISRFMIQGWSVVVYCIQLAIYMGFSEIYLLGCDQSLAYYSMGKVLESTPQTFHVNLKGEDESLKSIEKKMDNNGVMRITREYMVIERQFDILYKYCKDRNIKLCNLTDKSLISCMPNDTLENIKS